MVKITNVAIILFGQNQSYKPGDVVQGEVSLRVTRPAKITVIKIALGGFCKTKWKVGSGDNEKTYKEKEQYCLMEMVLWGGGDSGNHSPFCCNSSDHHYRNIYSPGSSNQETQLGEGELRKQFRFQLPNNCPSTFSSKHGNIWYNLVVICKFPGLMSSNIEVPREIIVRDMIDLSTNPATAELVFRPLQIQDSIKEDTCCCDCGPVSVKIDVTLNKSAYSLGELVILNGFIENGCPSPMPYTMVLKQQVICYGKRSDSFFSSGNLKSKEKTFELQKWNGDPVPARSRKTFQNESTMRIPNVVASDLRNCRLIDVGYYLKIKGILPGSVCDSAFELKKVTILIGGVQNLEQVNNVVTATAPPAPDPTGGLPSYNMIAPSAPPTVDIVDVKIDDTQPAPPSYEDSLGFNSTQPPPQEIDRNTAPSQTTYYDWSQSAFTYS